MDTSAIERIEALIGATQPLPEVGVPLVMVPPGCEVQDLERKMDVPRRMRVTFTTERLEDFCNYVSKEASEHTATFIRPDGGSAKAVIDFGSHAAPQWSEHKAQLTMKYTPTFKALKDACDARALSQRDLTDWLEDWRHVVSPYADDVAQSVGQAVQAIRKVDVKAISQATHEDGDFRAARSAMEEVEAKSSAGKLPGHFAVTCQVYPCTQQRIVTARLSLLTGSDKPAFRLRILGEEALMQEVAEEIELEIATRLQGMRVFIGEV